jgi:hypothetical protein
LIEKKVHKIGDFADAIDANAEISKCIRECVLFLKNEIK